VSWVGIYRWGVVWKVLLHLVTLFLEGESFSGGRNRKEGVSARTPVIEEKVKLFLEGDCSTQQKDTPTGRGRFQLVT